jgi:hypothetical protein
MGCSTLTQMIRLERISRSSISRKIYPNSYGILNYTNFFQIGTGCYLSLWYIIIQYTIIYRIYIYQLYITYT